MTTSMLTLMSILNAGCKYCIKVELGVAILCWLFWGEFVSCCVAQTDFHEGIHTDISVFAMGALTEDCCRPVYTRIQLKITVCINTNTVILMLNSTTASLC